MPQIILQEPILALTCSQIHVSRRGRCFIHLWNGYEMVMRPLLFVNWRQVSSRFTALMWLVACILAVVVLLHLPGGQFAAYSQKCTHLSCAVFYQPEEERLYCPCHEGIFSPASGDPIAGPPRRRLPRILLRRDGDVISAVGWEA